MKVKVWNDNIYPYTENFRDQKISIPSKDFIEMEYDDAHTFKGTFASMKFDADGQPLATGYKMIRVEGPAVPLAEVKTIAHLCQACRYLGLDDKDLAKHVEATHAAQKLVDEAAEAEIKAKSLQKKAV